MILEPKHPTKRYIEGRVAFHESGAKWYAKQNQGRLATWAREQAALWRAKLKPIEGRDSGDGE